MKQAVIPGNFKRRYKRSLYDSGVFRFTNSLLSPVYSSVDWWCPDSKWFTVVSFSFVSSSQTKIISHAQKNIISTDADIAQFLWRRKDSLSTKICSKHQKQQRRSSAALKIPLTVSPPWRNFPTASAEEFYYSFHYNEGLEKKLTRAPLFRLG